jgi:hypothetical protein
MGKRGIVLHVLNLDRRWKRMVNFTLVGLPPEERASITH